MGQPAHLAAHGAEQRNSLPFHHHRHSYNASQQVHTLIRYSALLLVSLQLNSRTTMAEHAPEACFDKLPPELLG